MILLNPVVLSVIVMSVLCLLKLNVLLALIVSALVAGFVAGMPIGDIMNTLIGGMGGQSETALSYILLGTLAVAIGNTGVASIISRKVASVINGKKLIILIIIAFFGSFSQNLIPVHIAYIPILIPPLISVMNKLKLDRRAMACSLTFSLKAPYIAIPAGFGLIFQGIIATQMTENGMPVDKLDVWKSTWILGAAMVIGLLIAMFFSYRKNREYQDLPLKGIEIQEAEKMETKHWLTLLAALAAFVVPVLYGSLPLGALAALVLMFVFGVLKWKDIDKTIGGGMQLMGLIAFIMLVASGYAAVIKQTGAVEELVNSIYGMIGGSKAIGVLLMLLVGLLVTMGIGTSFGTIPVVAAIYIPLCLKLGLSVPGSVVILAAAAALGDAGSPASDSTLGPTSGLNVDGQHDHIWDTCVPTFLHFNIPLIIAGFIGGMLF
ncbi:Na+/H+ antiporter family protein [Fusobacterium periodonticum]|uniref:Na+/H+ antiporter family protein n=1 Tax=Fusobacterium periodonticum ATCC 33693 TaxID=546275 RepID=D4CU13_9FUSO|nr:Na+/H+ antiporter NhaC family protein [Fusobacterium periodonticum]EFE87124.1 Na+/H+ antiporter family protein [Fusobacterium periodonticum ATCC 33693]